MSLEIIETGKHNLFRNTSFLTKGYFVSDFVVKKGNPQFKYKKNAFKANGCRINMHVS